ncbi:hypothetical protein V8G54_001447, partial [Vigna mungo]
HTIRQFPPQLPFTVTQFLFLLFLLLLLLVLLLIFLLALVVFVLLLRLSLENHSYELQLHIALLRRLLLRERRSRRHQGLGTLRKPALLLHDSRGSPCPRFDIVHSTRLLVARLALPVKLQGLRNLLLVLPMATLEVVNLAQLQTVLHSPPAPPLPAVGSPAPEVVRQRLLRSLRLRFFRH